MIAHNQLLLLLSAQSTYFYCSYCLWHTLDNDSLDNRIAKHLLSDSNITYWKIGRTCSESYMFVFLTTVYSICLPSRRSVFDMFNFLASKHRQPPEYRQQEDDDDEGQLRTARSVTAHTKSLLFFLGKSEFVLPQQPMISLYLIVIKKPSP